MIWAIRYKWLMAAIVNSAQEYGEVMNAYRDRYRRLNVRRLPTDQASGQSS